MELTKTTYKQTEIGLIPSEWEVKCLGDLGQFLKGKGIKKDEVVPDGIPCVRYGELYTVYSNKIERTVSFINESTSKESIQLRYGDLLFAGSGETKEEIGKSAVILRNDTYAGGDIVIFRSKDIDFQFLGYLSNFTPIQKQKSLNGQGDAVVHIYSGGLSKVKIALPPTLHEQKAIATALSDVDALISSLDKLISKKKSIKQGAMQRLFADRTNWKNKKIKDFGFDISDGNYSSKYPKSSEFKNSGIPFIRANNIKNMTVVDDDIRYISHELHAELKKGHIKKGDVLITNRGEIGQTALVPDKFIGSNINAQIVRINTNSKLNELYFFYYLRLNSTQNHILNMQTGSALKQLPVNRLYEIEIAYPEEEIQKLIGYTLLDIDADILNIATKKAKYQSIKQGMMQELLTGKTRLM